MATEIETPGPLYRTTAIIYRQRDINFDRNNPKGVFLFDCEVQHWLGMCGVSWREFEPIAIVECEDLQHDYQGNLLLWLTDESNVVRLTAVQTLLGNGDIFGVKVHPIESRDE